MSEKKCFGCLAIKLRSWCKSEDVGEYIVYQYLFFLFKMRFLKEGTLTGVGEKMVYKTVKGCWHYSLSSFPIAKGRRLPGLM